MKEFNLESLKSAWQNEPSFNQTRLSQADIKRFLKSSSKSITQFFVTGLKIDIILKSLLSISFIVLMFLFSGNQSVLLISILLLVISLAGIYLQLRNIRKIPVSNDAHEDLRSGLKSKIEYYHKYHIMALLVGALSSSLFILSGMMYYFYFKYNMIREFQWDDFIVFGGAIIIGFSIGAFIQIKIHNFHIKQLEKSLNEINEETITQYTINRQKNQRIKTIIIASLSIIAGLLLLTYFIIR